MTAEFRPPAYRQATTPPSDHEITRQEQLISQLLQGYHAASVSQAPPPMGGARFGLPNPYVDYGRVLTAEGGIAITYKDIDRRFRHTAWRLAALAGMTGTATECVRMALPILPPALQFVLVATVALVTWLIVARPITCYRQVEIRPDCMIIEQEEVFYRESFELGFPQCRPRPDNSLVLCGVYGTRFIEYLIIPRFDENDRAPEVFAAHLLAAMRQQWGASADAPRRS